jgi:catechol 2,3-dioxygenase-like lactoylglutathione lyase family enzyme
MALGKVSHVTVYVKDQQAALDFYRDKLGFDVVADMTTSMGENTMRWVTVRPQGGDGPEIALWPGTPQMGAERIGGNTGVTLYFGDLDATYSDLSSKGVNFTMPPGEVPWGRHAMVADQDGNQLYIVEPGGQMGG